MTAFPIARTTAQLGLDFPTDNYNLPASVKRVDSMIAQGELSGAEAVQALNAVGAAMVSLAEAISAPSGTYTGSAGSVAQAYAVVPEYPLDASPTFGSVNYPWANAVERTVFGAYSNLLGLATDAATMPGPPLEGRGMIGLSRTKRYGKLSPTLLVANTGTLGGGNSVAVTTPSFSSSYTAKTPTLAILKPCANVVIGGSFDVGDVVTIAIGPNTVTHTVVSGDTNLAGIASALQAAIESNSGAANACGVSLSASTLFFYAGNGAALTATVTGTGATVTAVASTSVLTGGGVIATGVVPGAQVLDFGTFVNVAPSLPPYPEVGVIPATTASGTIALTGVWGAGQTLIALVDEVVMASYTTTGGDANMAGSAMSFAAAIQAAVRAYSAGGAGFSGFTASASGATITCTYGIVGTSGNSIPIVLSNTTVNEPASTAILPVFTPGVPSGPYNQLAGGTAGGLLPGPRSGAGATGYGL